MVRYSLRFLPNGSGDDGIQFARRLLSFARRRVISQGFHKSLNNAKILLGGLWAHFLIE